MTDDRLKKLLEAARDQTGFYNSQDAEEAEQVGLVEVEGPGRIKLTDKGRQKLATL